jgi:L-amino acid N-acyltransferase YncA
MIGIHDAMEADLPEMLSIYNDIILNTTAVFDYDAHTLEMRKEWFAARKAEGFPVSVAKENGKVVGFSSIGPFRKWGAYQYSVENSLYVAAGFRGKGIGKLLLKELIDAAKQLKKHTIIAGIGGPNEASIALHKSFGFKEVACLKEVGYKFNQWLDLRFLQLMI